MKSSKLKKRLYRNIGYTLILLFSFFICYKTYQTQRIKQRQNFREGFKEGIDIDGGPQQAKAELDQAINDAVNACVESCPVSKDQCPQKSECDKGKDGKECRDEVADCGKATKDCKKACKAPKPAK